jgi:hypothetical protein
VTIVFMKNIHPISCQVILYLVWKRKTLVGVYNEVETAYCDKAMNCMCVFKWSDMFKKGLISVHDDQSGRPSILRKLWEKKNKSTL